MAEITRAPRQTLRSLNANGREGRAPPHDAWSDRPAGPWPPGPSRIAWELSLPPGTGSGRSLHAELRRPAGHCPGTHTDMSYGACSVSGTPGRSHAECQTVKPDAEAPPGPARPIDPSPLRVETRALTVSGACTAWRTARSLENMIVSAVPCRRPWHRPCVDGGYATSPLPNGMGAHGRALHSENGLSMTNCLA